MSVQAMASHEEKERDGGETPAGTASPTTAGLTTGDSRTEPGQHYRKNGSMGDATGSSNTSGTRDAEGGRGSDCGRRCSGRQRQRQRRRRRRRLVGRAYLPLGSFLNPEWMREQRLRQRLAREKEAGISPTEEGEARSHIPGVYRRDGG